MTNGTPEHDTGNPAAESAGGALASADAAERLSGPGFLRLARLRRRQLLRIAAVAAVAHLLGLAVFGGYVVLSSRRDEPALFTVPPPVRTYEPRQLEHKVKLQRRQRSSSRPAMVPRIVAARVTDLALPEVKTDPKRVTTAFQPKFKAVSGKGLGAGLGTGYGTSGFGDGFPSVDFFGIQARGERIAILVDVSISMVEEQRGGAEGFVRVKTRVDQVVDALRDGTLFTLIVFADGCSVLAPELLHASPETRRRAKAYLRPFNTPGQFGLTEGNITGSPHGLPAAGGTTRLDLALGAALDRGCDTLLILSDGMPQVEKSVSLEQIRAYQERVARWREQNAGRLADFDAAPVETRRVWVPPQAAVPASKQPLREGAPPPRDIPARAGYWREVSGRRGGVRRPEPPASPRPELWTLADFVQHIERICEAVYKPQGRKPPKVHTIGYMIDRDGHEFLQRLARQYQGQYRRVQSLR